MLTGLQNVEKAQKEIDQLETEAKESPTPTSGSGRRTQDAARKPATANQAVNGTASAEAELAQEQDAAADVAKDLKSASVEDKADAESS